MTRVFNSLFLCKNKMLPCLQLVGLNDVCYVSEHSEVNPQSKTMNLKSRNVSFVIMMHSPMHSCVL